MIAKDNNICEALQLESLPSFIRFRKNTQVYSNLENLHYNHLYLPHTNA